MQFFLGIPAAGIPQRYFFHARDDVQGLVPPDLPQISKASSFSIELMGASE
ncbi:MAG: hypothetical protein HWN70_00880 [Desulfobacterales bacterium]|nr:hypothetical protein [Desulfobacterales bacterium]